ncbi:MAG: HNH endonuclease signature motif containing protein [Polyangiales bacterium]
MAISERLAQAVRLRGGGSCAYCLRRLPLTVDHVTPLAWFEDPLSTARGEPDAPSNLVPACGYCNSLKRDMNLATFAVYLRERYGRDTTSMVARVLAQCARPLPTEQRP